MSIYHDSAIVTASDGLSCTHFATADAPVVEDVAEELEGEKSLKSHTVSELKKIAKGLGIKPDITDGLLKDELIDVIKRITHSSDD